MAGSMALTLMLGAAAFSEKRAAPRDTTPYTGPRRPFAPRPLMDRLRADPSRRAEKTGFDFFIAITVDGKKVTVRTVLTGGEEIDRVVLRDAQGRNLAPRAEEK